MTTRRVAVLPSLPIGVDSATLNNRHELSVGVKAVDGVGVIGKSPWSCARGEVP